MKRENDSIFKKEEHRVDQYHIKYDNGYFLLGFIDDVMVPLLECYFSKKEREILYYRFMTKMIVWLIVVLFCLGMEKKIGV